MEGNKISESINMVPILKTIDHVHVYVPDRQAAARWYQRILGLTPVEALRSWASNGGPLTLSNSTGTVHIALFESDKGPTTTAAFGVNGQSFLDWKTHFEEHSIEIRITDHTMAWSMYFSDPYDNLHEITSYDTGLIADSLA